MDADRPERQRRNLFYAVGSEGVLQSITQRNKYTQALTYSHGQIAFVSDSYSRQLTFGYSSGLLSDRLHPGILRAASPTAMSTFSSTANSSQTVTYDTSPARRIKPISTRTPAFPYALTGITDENGNRYATWGYDSIGRGILSRACRRGELHVRLLTTTRTATASSKARLASSKPTNSRPCRASRKSPRSTAPQIPPWSPPRKPSPTIRTATAAA